MRLLICLCALLLSVPAQAAWTIPNNGGRATLGTPHVRHIQIPAATRGAVGTQPTPSAMGTAHCLQFASTGTSYAYFQWEVPEDWTGGNITVEVDWAPDSGAMSGSDTIQWVIDYGARAVGEALNGSTSQAVGTVDADISQYVTTHTAHTIAYNDPTNPLTHEDHLFFRITRNTGVANDFGGTACITAFEIIYTSDGFPETN